MTYLSTTGTPPVGAPGPSGPLRMTPGRWAALAVAVPVALALIGWTGFSLVSTVAKGAYPFSYAVPVQDGRVAVNISAGNVTLRQGPGGTTRLTGIVSYGLDRPSISEVTTPGGVNVGLNCDDINNNCGMNATLAVPARTAVTLGSNGGDIAASGFSSNVTLSAQGGNVTANDLAGALNLDTGGGDLTGSGLSGSTIVITAEGGNVGIGNVNGPTRVDTGGGDLTAISLTGNLQVVAEGGNVDVEGLSSSQVVVQSGGGDINLVFNTPPKDLQITAQGGNVNVVLPAGDTKYDISTPDTEGGNVNYPPALDSPTSANVISADSGGGDITIIQGSAKLPAP